MHLNYNNFHKILMIGSDTKKTQNKLFKCLLFLLKIN